MKVPFLEILKDPIWRRQIHFMQYDPYIIVEGKKRELAGFTARWIQYFNPDGSVSKVHRVQAKYIHFNEQDTKKIKERLKYINNEN